MESKVIAIDVPRIVPEAEIIPKKNQEVSNTEVPLLPVHGIHLRIGSALFYSIISILIMIINKQCLTIYQFPPFQVLGLGQMIATIVVLRSGKAMGIISFPDLTWSTFKQMNLLPLLYLGNMVFGLGGTQKLSLPMFTALRRLELWITIVGEITVLKIYPPVEVTVSVSVVILGSLIAASNDLSFNAFGYFCVFMSDFFTAGVVVMTKSIINKQQLGKLK